MQSRNDNIYKPQPPLSSSGLGESPEVSSEDLAQPAESSCCVSCSQSRNFWDLNAGCVNCNWVLINSVTLCRTSVPYHCVCTCACTHKHAWKHMYTSKELNSYLYACTHIHINTTVLTCICEHTVHTQTYT